MIIRHSTDLREHISHRRESTLIKNDTKSVEILKVTRGRLNTVSVLKSALLDSVWAVETRLSTLFVL